MESTLRATLECNLKELRLSRILETYSEAAKLALEERYSYEHYLHYLSGKEVEYKFNNRVRALIQAAKFPKVKTLDSYDFGQVNIPKENIIEMSHGNFLSDHTNIIFFGSSGAGKTHLALAIGRELCIRGKKVKFYTGCELVQELVKAKNNLTLTNYFKKLLAYDLIIIDELGYIPFGKNEAELLFQFISDRYEKKSLLITTNLAFSEWEKVFIDPMVTVAAIDRLIHYSKVFQFKTGKDESFRAQEAKRKLKKEK